MEQQEAPDFSVDTVKLYLAEEGVTAASRIRSKILGTGILVPLPPLLHGVTSTASSTC